MTCCAGKPVCCIAALLECEAVARFDGLPPCRPRGATSFGRLEDDRRRHKKIKLEHHRTNEEDEELHGNLHECVEQQAEPFRRPGQPFDASVPVASRIIRVANAYDDMVGGSIESQHRSLALDRLRAGTVDEYDPTVVDLVSRAVERTMLLDV